jgi:hypothetical protein
MSAGLTEIKLTLGASSRHGSAELGAVFDAYYAMGELVDLVDYRAGLSDRTRMMRDWSLFLDHHPLVLTPLLMRPVPWDYGAQGPAAVEDLFRSAIYSYGSTSSDCRRASCRSTSSTACRPASGHRARFREDLVLDALEAIETRAGSLVGRLWATWRTDRPAAGSNLTTSRMAGSARIPGRNLTTSGVGRDRPIRELPVAGALTGRERPLRRRAAATSRPRWRVEYVECRRQLGRRRHQAP